MIKEAISRLVARSDLTQHEMESVLLEIMEGKATHAQIAACITALRMKGETIEEITGAAQAIRSKAARIEVDRTPLLDIVGTGGTGLKKFNISTASAFVIASTGIAVAKHGNRAASSRCGSADVLEAFGISLEVPPEKVKEAIEVVGIGFLYAPAFHQSMKHVAVPRREVGIRTIFNLLGPLCNPANITTQVLGVYNGQLLRPLVQVLKNLGIEDAMAVHGEDGLDEVTITGATTVAECRSGVIREYVLNPEDFGIEKRPVSDVVGGETADNAQIIRDVLGGEPGIARDMVLMNAACGIFLGGKATSLREGVAVASRAIDSGDALQALKRFKEFTMTWKTT